MSGKFHKKLRQLSRRRARLQWDQFFDLLETLPIKDRATFAWNLVWGKHARAALIAQVGVLLISVALGLS